MVYVKPIVPVSLIYLYFKFVKESSLLFPLSMLVIAITDVFIYLDFVKYYTVIAVLIFTFYGLCSFLLKDFISKKDVKLKVFASPPVIVSIILIGYLIFSIIDLVLPKIINSVGAMSLIVIGLLLFVTICFFIYVSDRYEKSIYLFIAACCTLFVDALLAINELYYYSREFTILINGVEILGIYFFTKFFIDRKPIDIKSINDTYF
ncbi:hypothetical protein ACSTS3_02990 [Aquimarina muelleri]|uniref:hypothetical protein n=1 Tax=Aquimarina muelleri TaxID=279356 RepID=UPI003F687580